jgi:CRISPR-associated endonuclease/helicase Cas3
MTMDRADFSRFFAAVNDGHNPFGWQERLLDTLLRHGRWPDQIAAPTGAGKTSAIDIHVFATALTVASGGPRLPRRLAMVVDRRVLVDDQYERARALARLLARPEDDVVAEVAKVLASLYRVEGEPGADDPVLVTARLRGGSVPSRSWRDYPTACAVLCATPDMWGSRLMLRGYGTSDEAAPREAGLLAFDSVVLVDEAHLARQLLCTARRVGELAQVAQQPVSGVPSLQVVEVSATPAEEGTERSVIFVEPGDLAEERLAKRLTRPKPVRLAAVAGWPPAGRQVGKAAAAIARAVTEMRAAVVAAADRADGAGNTVGCYVNTVPMALAVADALRRESLRVVTVCGQVRPADLARLTARYAGILTTRGSDDVDVIVTTQSLEVGADLDLAGIVTELASGSALAQRAGRVNRLGRRERGLVTVIVPDGPPSDKARSGPYSAQELRAALTWVTERAADPAGLAPWSLRESPPPPAARHRMLYQRPELGDAWHWARTSDALAADPELELWLSDSLEAETSVGIVVRDAVPGDPADAVEFVRDLPPAPWEVFPVPYRTAQAVLAELLEQGVTAMRVRGEDIAPLALRASGGAAVRPGDVVVADSSAEIFTRAVEGGFSPPVVAGLPSDADDAEQQADAAHRGRAADVLHHQPDPRRGTVVLRLEWSPGREPVAGFAQDAARQVIEELAGDFEDLTERMRRDSLARLLTRLPDEAVTPDLRPVLGAVIGLLNGKVRDADLTLRALEDGGARIVVKDRRKAIADEDLRQVFTPSDVGPVLLSAHQRDVAHRAELVAAALQLPEDLTRALSVAGEHHDDGKADRRFQEVRLGLSGAGLPGAGEPLAKSLPGKTTREVLERQAAGGLPSRWRHEQRSVVDAWPTVRAVPDIDPQLALRLIGTSHGHGRSGFPHSAAELAAREDPARWHDLATELFDLGGWDELIEATQVRYGVWGCAYLEALLRAADCQVSGEGR